MTFSQRVGSRLYSGAHTLSFTLPRPSSKSAENSALTPDDPAYSIRSSYDEEFPDLVQFITPHMATPNGESNSFWRGVFDADGGHLRIPSAHDPRHREAFTIASGMSTAPAFRSTRCRRVGTCRDLRCQDRGAARLGIAARFVSAIFHPATRHGYAARLDHAGCRSICRAPAGSSSIRPTAYRHPRSSFVSGGPDPRQRSAHGAYLGSADAFAGMDSQYQKSVRSRRGAGRKVDHEIKVGFEITMRQCSDADG